MKKTPGSQSAFFNTSLLVGLFLLVGVFVVFFTASADSRRAPGDGNLSVHNDFTRSGRQSTLPNRIQARTFARVRPNGISIENLAASGTPRHSEATTTLTRPEGPTLGPLGNTLWQVDDDNAIADGVSIDANDVWGAWTLQGARLSAYPILGDGTPDFELSSFGSGNSGVDSAKGADRMAYMESNAAGTDFRVHGFRSTSAGIPDWSFPFPVSDPNLPASSKKVAVSYDGSTVASVVSDSVTQNSTLYVFEADTGAI